MAMITLVFMQHFALNGDCGDGKQVWDLILQGIFFQPCVVDLSPCVILKTNGLGNGSCFVFWFFVLFFSPNLS